VNTEPPGIGGFSDVEKVYSLEPVAPTLTPVAKAHIIGVQANLWTEYIGSTNHAEYMVLPRMGALAEVQWLQPEAKDFEAFKLRLDHLRRIYERYGWHYAHHLWPEEFRKVAKMY
jgi:hexosaminidase